MLSSSNKDYSHYVGGVVFEPAFVGWKRGYRGDWISVCSGRTKDEVRQLGIQLYGSRDVLTILPFGKVPKDDEKRGGLAV